MEPGENSPHPGTPDKKSSPIFDRVKVKIEKLFGGSSSRPRTLEEQLRAAVNPLQLDDKQLRNKYLEIR